VIVEEGHKDEFINSLDWLSSVCPIAYQYRNTKDGYKILFEDGVFCEFAIFERLELSYIPFAHGRVVWKRPYVDASVAVPKNQGAVTDKKPVEWLVGEVLTNLYVGLSRYRRGEKLSAARFIQHFAVDRLLELSERIEESVPAPKDIFAPERRFEERFPTLAKDLPGFIQGYERGRESAGAIMDYLERHFEVNPAMAEAIRGLY
jgi:hypothetical protein